MTIAHPLAASTDAPMRRRASLGVTAWVALACLTAFAFSWSHLLVVWRTGSFFDTDDAMRMVQVRDWLAGQGWYDLTAHRLSPPGGLLMHWSRVVDLPVGFLVRLFGLLVPAASAERLARIVFPLGCQALLILAFLRAALVLCGPRSFGPALLLIVLNGFEFSQFVAGRIDHHAPQIVLLTTITGAVAAGLRGAGRNAGIIAAGAMALSLAISLENLPFMAVAVLAVAAFWITDGSKADRFVEGFGFGAAFFVAVLFVATVPPSRYGAVCNDALSLPHLLIAVVSGLGWGCLTRIGWLAPSRTRRLAGLACQGLFTIGVIRLLCPAFPGSPYAALDPIVREIWLNHVSEALPLPTVLRLDPAAVTMIVVPLSAGLLSSLVALATTRGDERRAWALIAAMTAVGLIGACWEVRVTTSTMPLAALGGLWTVMQAGGSLKGRSIPMPTLRMLLALCPFSPILCAALPSGDESPAVIAARTDAEMCRSASALQPLASLPPGLVFAPIDSGAHLLAYTRLSVLAAPYHRNNAGNRAVIEGFMANPETAEAQLKALEVTYVAICRGGTQLRDIILAAPSGLAARLAAEKAPSWLRPVEIAGTPYRLWQVQ